MKENLNFNEDAEISDGDLFYNLANSYIKPLRLLECPETAQKVKEAAELVQRFFDAANEQDVIAY